MPREFSRSARVAQSVKRAIAPMVNDWVREHGAGMASVTTTDVSPDMKQFFLFVKTQLGYRLRKCNCRRIEIGLGRVAPNQPGIVLAAHKSRALPGPDKLAGPLEELSEVL